MGGGYQGIGGRLEKRARKREREKARAGRGSSLNSAIENKRGMRRDKRLARFARLALIYIGDYANASRCTLCTARACALPSINIYWRKTRQRIIIKRSGVSICFAPLQSLFTLHSASLSFSLSLALPLRLLSSPTPPPPNPFLPTRPFALSLLHVRAHLCTCLLM